LRQHGYDILAAAGIILALGAVLVFMLRQARRNRLIAAELSGSLSTLNATFDSTADGVLVVDKDGRVSACNERFLELWSIPRELATRTHDDGFLRHALLKGTLIKAGVIESDGKGQKPVRSESADDRSNG
jgi:PAS domain-containing protein